MCPDRRTDGALTASVTFFMMVSKSSSSSSPSSMSIENSGNVSGYVSVYLTCNLIASIHIQHSKGKSKLSIGLDLIRKKGVN